MFSSKKSPVLNDVLQACFPAVIANIIRVLVGLQMELVEVIETNHCDEPQDICQLSESVSDSKQYEKKICILCNKSVGVYGLTNHQKTLWNEQFVSTIWPLPNGNFMTKILETLQTRDQTAAIVRKHRDSYEYLLWWNDDYALCCFSGNIWSCEIYDKWKPLLKSLDQSISMWPMSLFDNKLGTTFTELAYVEVIYAVRKFKSRVVVFWQENMLVIDVKFPKNFRIKRINLSAYIVDVFELQNNHLVVFFKQGHYDIINENLEGLKRSTLLIRHDNPVKQCLMINGDLIASTREHMHIVYNFAQDDEYSRDITDVGFRLLSRMIRLSGEGLVRLAVCTTSNVLIFS